MLKPKLTNNLGPSREYKVLEPNEERKEHLKKRLAILNKQIRESDYVKTK